MYPDRHGLRQHPPLDTACRHRLSSRRRNPSNRHRSQKIAKLNALPEHHIISSFRRVLDFYLWKGIVCARSWPRKPTRQRSPAVQRGIADFRAAAAAARLANREVIDAYSEMAAGVSYTWKDLYFRGYLSGFDY